jgi:hypothetical protein
MDEVGYDTIWDENDLIAIRGAGMGRWIGPSETKMGVWSGNMCCSCSSFPSLFYTPYEREDAWFCWLILRVELVLE